MPEILIGKNLALESLMRAPLSPASRMIAELAIDSVPVVDAEPVRHGRWETIDPSFSSVYCSECGAAADKYLAMRYKGCPFCLCVMDATNTNCGKGGADNG